MDQTANYSSGFTERGLVSPPPSLGETIGTMLELDFAPILDRFIVNNEPKQGYNPLNDIKGYEAFAGSFVESKNPEYTARLKKTIDDNIARQQRLGEASFGNLLVAGSLSPYAFLKLPFGGPVAGFGRSALRVGGGSMAIQAGIEAVAQNFDPTRSAKESAIYIATAGIFGAGVGGVLSVPLTTRARSFNNTLASLEAEFKTVRQAELVTGLSREELFRVPARENRAYGKAADADLNQRLIQLNRQADELEAKAEPGPLGQDIRDEANSIRAQGKPLENEIAFRSIEEIRENPTDPWSIKSSWFTDSVAYKMVSTPLKRAFQSDYPSKVKETFARTFADAGITLNLHAAGIATEQSVAMKAATAEGRWVAVYDEVAPLWAIETGASSASKLDFMPSDVVARFDPNKTTMSDWLSDVTTRWLKSDKTLSENQSSAARAIQRFFEDAGLRLEDVGLIGTEKGMATRIKQVEAELADLRAAQKKVSQKIVVTKDDAPRKQSIPVREAKMLQDRIANRENFLKYLQDEQAGLADFNISPETKENYFPRFWDRGVISKRREEFARILYDWYSENPYVFEIDPSTGRYVRKQLRTSPDAIQERVEGTIRKILNEPDPTSVDNISLGYGRSAHFRHRQIDIPNSLVTDFIITDPMAVMKAYASRIESRVEFAKAFNGKDVESVLFDLELEMVRNGASEAKINAMRRDYLHMYERVAGAVQRSPDTLDKKIAYVLREAASYSYMGSAGYSAIPDFGRIVMEYELENVIRGIQAMMDKNMVNLTVNEVRLAGEAIDILKGSAHLRMTEDLGNNMSANEFMTRTRNAFYILNGLAPMTVIAKQLAGIIDAHTIIDYSIKLGKGKLDDQSRVWLARYGITEDMAARIANAPWEKTENGLIFANTKEWTSPETIEKIARSRLAYKYPKKEFSKMSDAELNAHFAQEFDGVSFYTDEKVVEAYFKQLQDAGYENLIAFMTDVRDIPGQGFSIHLSRKKITERFNSLKADSRSSKEILDKAKAALDNGKIDETSFYHIKNDVEAADLFETVDDYFQYIISHELHHSRVERKAGESIASWENRIDQTAINYIRNQRTEGFGLALSKEMEAVAAEQNEMVYSFRAALNSGVLNTIMSGTPADKPIITDGVAYIPMRVAEKFGMKEDKKYRGYARIENGLMGLPFQFYSFSLANINKTVGALAHGQIKNRMIGVTTMVGLGYLSMKLKTPEFAWEDMSWQDKFTRSFDASGVAALYSDLMYTGLQTSLALGGPNITNGILSPKFPQQPSLSDAILGLSGAGPSWGADMARGIYTFASGDYGPGAKDVIRNLPFARMWFWKDEMNQLTYAMAN